MKKRLIILLSIAFSTLSLNVKAEVTFPDAAFSNLDYGLYWFDYNDAKKANVNEPNPYYNANNKTVIYIHGWQNGSVTERRRETLNRSNSGGPNEDLAWYWLDRGYNVGILYWNQFADESEVKDAEAKIHSASGPRNMRWKSSNGSYSSGPSSSVTQLLYNSLTNGMPNFNGSELRIAGHSLGNQLALTISEKLDDAVNRGVLTSSYRPNRIALLDPFYSIGEKSYLNNDWTGERSKSIVDALKAKGIAIEAYRSSPVTSTFLAGDNNASLMNSIAFSELKPWNFAWWQVAEKHGAAVTHYFWSRAFSPLTLDGSNTQVPSASASSAVIKTWMNKNKGVIQDSGAYSATPADDDFKEKSRLQKLTSIHISNACVIKVQLGELQRCVQVLLRSSAHSQNYKSSEISQLRMQFSLFETPENNSSSHKLPLSEGDVTYFPQAIPKNDADTFFEQLQSELPWRQDTIKLFGKPVKIPRLQSWHGDEDCTYTYSNLTMSPNPWTNRLLSIKDCCEALCAPIQNTKFNSVLANWYRNGQDSMSFHSDDEPELGINPVIASVTLGEARPFVFKHKETKEKYTQVLEHGSVLIMAGTTQSHYVHGIAKTAKPIGGRINLTFRHLIHRTR